MKNKITKSDIGCNCRIDGLILVESVSAPINVDFPFTIIRVKDAYVEVVCGGEQNVWRVLHDKIIL